MIRQEFLISFVVGVIIGLVFSLSVIYASSKPKDSTDPIDVRSGLEIKVDAMTGCQYLATTKSGLTPRLDANGKQICGGEE